MSILVDQTAYCRYCKSTIHTYHCEFVRKQRKMNLPLPIPVQYQCSLVALEILLRPGNSSYDFDPSSAPQKM